MEEKDTLDIWYIDASGQLTKSWGLKLYQNVVKNPLVMYDWDRDSLT